MLKKNGPSANEGERARAASVVPPQFPVGKMPAGPLVGYIGRSRAALLGAGCALPAAVLRRTLEGHSAACAAGAFSPGPAVSIQRGPPTLLDQRQCAIAGDHTMAL